MTGVTIAPEDSDTELLGKYASALQSDVAIGDGLVTGTLKYVTGYTGFSGDTAEQSGNYLAMRVDTDDNTDVITVELVGGSVGHPVTLDSDRNIVIRITDPIHQKIRVVVTNAGGTDKQTYTYKLYRLNLEEAE